MSVQIFLIRHSKTAGNLLGRYIGTTDEPLCEEGRALLAGVSYPRADILYVSPRKRCVETAAILYPGQELIQVPDLRECDFGDFENKNYQELSGNADYQAWVDSGGKLPFPNGENHADFKARCGKAFEKTVLEALEQDVQSLCFVVHGGTIMSILECYARPKRSFYDYQVKNGCGYVLELEKEPWQSGGARTLTICQKLSLFR